VIEQPRSRWVPVGWDALPGWGEDQLALAWPALLRSCLKPAPGWERLCAEAAAIPEPDETTVRTWLQRRLQPYRVEAHDGSAEGLITGYFEPLIEARRQPDATFRVPLYRPPADFGKRKPYWSRAQLETLPAARAALKGRELAYVADPLDALVLHIQGSGRLLVTEPDGSQRLVRAAFAGHNDHPYRSVGRWLVDQGAFSLDQASWPAIKAWARANPGRVQEMLRVNPRYVFFREEPLPDPAVGPLGARGRAADAGALDRGRPRIHPLRHAGVDRHHRAHARPGAAAAPAAAPGDGAGHGWRDRRRGARRLLLGLDRRRGGIRRPHEAAAAHVGAVAALVSAAPLRAG